MKRPLTLGAAALLASCAQTASLPPSAATLAGADRCVAVSAAEFGASEASATWVPASENLPAFCEVTAELNPEPQSNIGVVYRLPQSWNGKVLGIGGGGWAGNVTLAEASDGLKKGYATLQTDGGHPGTNPWENSWAQIPAKATDFSHRAIHLMTEAGKRLADRYYGRAHSRAYFNGCSTGGRMALMEAQRYPGDYDGIVAGAPVYTLQVQTTSLMRNLTFAGFGGASGFTPAELQMVQNASLAQCDARDGLQDGLISDPASCTWQPRSLVCKPGESEDCLSEPQVLALETLYAGRRAPDGSWFMHPLMRGGEADWAIFMGADGSGRDSTGGGGLIGLEPVIFGADPPDWSDFTEADYHRVRSSDFARHYEADDPDLSGFFARGGKLITWYGLSDPGPSPQIGADYAQAVAKANPRSVSGHFRYFTLPGVGHCRGGAGADRVDWIDAIDAWVETGVAPEAVVGTKDDSALTRKHCAWPNVARYTGSGDTNDPANYACVARTS